MEASMSFLEELRASEADTDKKYVDSVSFFMGLKNKTASKSEKPKVKEEKVKPESALQAVNSKSKAVIRDSGVKTPKPAVEQKPFVLKAPKIYQTKEASAASELIGKGLQWGKGALTKLLAGGEHGSMVKHITDPGGKGVIGRILDSRRAYRVGKAMKSGKTKTVKRVIKGKEEVVGLKKTPGSWRQATEKYVKSDGTKGTRTILRQEVGVPQAVTKKAPDVVKKVKVDKGQGLKTVYKNIFNKGYLPSAEEAVVKRKGFSNFQRNLPKSQKATKEQRAVLRGESRALSEREKNLASEFRKAKRSAKGAKGDLATMFHGGAKGGIDIPKGGAGKITSQTKNP